MKIIALSIGHGPVKDLGAVSKDGKTNERDWNRDLVEIMKRKFNHAGIHVHIINRRIEKTPPVNIINATSADLAVEFHLNAYTGEASGTEMIYFTKSIRGRALAAALQSAAVKVLGLPDRGIKEPVNGRGLQLLRDTDMPCVIAESFFIDNPEDLKRGNERKEALAQAYADALTVFALSLPDK